MTVTPRQKGAVDTAWRRQRAETAAKGKVKPALIDREAEREAMERFLREREEKA